MAAAHRAARGKRERPEVRRFLARLEQNVDQIGAELRGGTYAFGPYRNFSIRDPKRRVIHAPSFRDRVVHHAIIGATGETFERGAISTSHACREGLGLDAAILCARRRAATRPAFLKLDVARYYDSIDHDLLRAGLRRRFREEQLLALLDRLIASYEALPGHGLPIGALTSQFLGNFYLGPLDHWAESHSDVRGYQRYMDDMLFFGNLDTLRSVRRGAVDRLALIGLEPSGGGVLNRCSLGVPWLGFTLYPNRTRLNAQGRKRLRRRLGSIQRGLRSGRCDERHAQDVACSMLAHASRATDVRWRRNLVTGIETNYGIGEAQERVPTRRARGLLERNGQELSLRVPQQEGALQPEQEPGLPGLFAPRNGGADAPPDDAPSRALSAAANRDESRGRSPMGTEIRPAGEDRSAEVEKGPIGEPPPRGAEGEQ